MKKIAVHAQMEEDKKIISKTPFKPNNPAKKSFISSYHKN
jgi:hypothetical protein